MIIIDQDTRNWFGAIRKDDTSTIKKMLKNGFDVNSRDKNGRTAIFYNISNTTFLRLINSGIDVNIVDKTNETALMVLCYNKSKYNSFIIKKLIELRTDLSIISYNSWRGNCFDINKKLFEDINIQNCIMTNVPEYVELMKDIKIHPEIEEKYEEYFNMNDIGLF